jgi:transposase-like protein
MATGNAPKTLQQAILFFADYENCHDALAAVRWPDGIVKCPRCGSARVTYLAKAGVWKCYEGHALAKFSLKVGTVFEDSPLPLSKWLPALWLLTNCKNGISSYELARALGVTQKTAWFMLQRLRLALQGEDGGKARNMSTAKKRRIGMKGKSTGFFGKVAVMGLLERNTGGNSRVRARVIKNNRKPLLQAAVRGHVTEGANVYTDALASYTGLDSTYVHGVIDHAECYVKGNVHTNGCENFWSLLKRAIKGTYVSVEPFHLFRYLDEQAFRFNERGGNVAQRFVLALAGIVHKRLTYKVLIGSDVPQTC